MNQDQLKNTAVKLAQPVSVGILPLAAMNLVKGSLGLDSLHIILVELVWLLLFQVTMQWTRSQPVIEEPASSYKPAPPLERKAITPKVSLTVSQPSKLPPKQSDAPLYKHALYSAELLDETMVKLVEILDPDSLSVLHKQPSANALHLSEWPQIFKDDNLQVSKHPSITALYAITCNFPTLPMRSLWELLLAVQIRADWDNMCEGTEMLDTLGIWPPDKDATKSRQAAVDYRALKASFPVSAKDLVLLSALARLPDKGGRRRLIAATTSVNHPRKPPQSGYSRMTLSISGATMEDDGTGGCVFTLVTDLSQLGSWIPTKIINLVTTKIIPKSVHKMGEAAASTPWSKERQQLTGDDWLPPPLEVYTETSPISDQEEADQEDETETVPASEARSQSVLVKQLRVLEGRIAQLEGSPQALKRPASASSSTQVANSPWWTFNWLFGTRRSNDSRGADGPDLALLIKTTLASSVGGFVGAAAFVATAASLVTYFNRIRR